MGTATVQSSQAASWLPLMFCWSLLTTSWCVVLIDLIAAAGPALLPPSPRAPVINIRPG